VSASGAEVFARLAAEGSDALHRGDARTAVERLSAALRAGTAGEDVLDARADLLEARLRLGGHRSAVPELQSLAALHPGRERVRRLLAVALARSGRRSEALAVCRSAPRGPLLACLERSIERGEPLLSERRRGRIVTTPRPALALAAAALAVVATAGAAILVGGREPADERETERLADVAPPAVVPSEVVAPVTTLPYANDHTGLWSTRADRSAVTLVGADGEPRRTVPIDGHVDALAAAQGSVWVVDAEAERLLRLSQRGGRPMVSVPLPRGELGRPGAPAVEVDGGNVWATNGGPLLRLDAATGRVRERINLDGPTALAADAGGGAWVGTRTGDVVRVALRSGRSSVSHFQGVPGRVVRLLLAHGSLWVARGEPGEASLWRYRTSPAAIVGAPLRGRFTDDLAVRPGALWARLPSSAYARIDARTSEVRLVDREIRPVR
jgi:hypothetical protein